MATEAPTQNLPLLFKGLEPLSANAHGKMKVRPVEKVPQVAQAHAIPATVDEFTLLSRHYPIIFAVGEAPIPLALMGLSEGANVFVDSDGKPLEKNLYMPAYIRRYPFLLAKLREDTDELSLCFDPTADAVGDFKDGEPLFDDEGEPSAVTKSILQFCEQFEAAGQRTAAFMNDLQKSGLLMDGEVAIQPEGAPQPFTYRGFRMVDEEKLRGLSAEDLKKYNESGLLALVYAHLFSLSQIRELFGRQLAQGKGPAPIQNPQTAEA